MYFSFWRTLEDLIHNLGQRWVRMNIEFHILYLEALCNSIRCLVDEVGSMNSDNPESQDFAGILPEYALGHAVTFYLRQGLRICFEGCFTHRYLKALSSSPDLGLL